MDPANAKLPKGTAATIRAADATKYLFDISALDATGGVAGGERLHFGHRCMVEVVLD